MGCNDSFTLFEDNLKRSVQGEIVDVPGALRPWHEVREAFEISGSPGSTADIGSRWAVALLILAARRATALQLFGFEDAPRQAARERRATRSLSGSAREGGATTCEHGANGNRAPAPEGTAATDGPVHRAKKGNRGGGKTGEFGPRGDLLGTQKNANRTSAR